MNLNEPCIFKLYFFQDSQLETCATAIKQISEKCQLSLEAQNNQSAFTHQDLKGLLQEFVNNQKKTSKSSFDVFQDVPCTFTSNIHQLTIRYFQKEDGAEGIFTITLALNLDTKDVLQGWKELDKNFPYNILKVYWNLSQCIMPYQKGCLRTKMWTN